MFVPIEATHILLGRPWQFDRKTLHDGLTNKISFTFHGHKVTLKSLSPKEVHEDQIKMKNKRENEKEKERKDKSGHNISSYTTKSIMLTRAMLPTAPSRCPSSLSFSLPNKTNYLTSWTKKYWDEHQTPPKGIHLLRGFISPSPFIPNYFFPKWLVCRDSPFELPKLKEHKFVSLSTPCTLLYVNKITTLFAGVLNSRSDSQKPRGHDTIQANKDMTKDSHDHSHYEKSSQLSNEDPTKDLADLTRRRNGQRPEHQMFFLLVFLKLKHVVNNLDSLYRSK